MFFARLVRNTVFAAAVSASVQNASAFGFLDRLFHPDRYQQTAYAPVVPCYGACAAPAVQTAYYAPQPCSTCTTTCTQRVCNYVPQTAYRTSYVPTPVTTYRPFVSGDACTGCTTTCMRPVTSYVLRPTVTPYTTYRQVCQTVASQPYVTSMPAVASPYAANPYAVAMPTAPIAPVSYAYSSPSPYSASAAYAPSAYAPPVYAPSTVFGSGSPMPTPYAPSGLIAPSSSGCSTCAGGASSSIMDAVPYSDTYSSPVYTAPGSNSSGAIVGDDARTPPSLPQGSAVTPAPGSDAGLSSGANRPVVPNAANGKANDTRGGNAEDIRYRTQPSSNAGRDSVAWQKDGSVARYTKASARQLYARPAPVTTKEAAQRSLDVGGWEASR